MKILFICGAAEPGKDGVGDYTRRLCSELSRVGNTIRIVALCDNYSTQVTTETQIIENCEIQVHRFPLSISNNSRFLSSQEIINQFNPDWISLQFVPYSFDPKGLPFWLPSFLNRLKGNHKWQIMFHELWIGMDVKSTFKSKCIGVIQKILISKILRIRANIVTSTQTNLYQSKIKVLGSTAQLLPLFSNILNHSESRLEEVKGELELKFCIFGNIHFGAPVAEFIDDLKAILINTKEKVLKFVFIGNCGVGMEDWINVLRTNKINFETTGFISDKEISNILSSCNYGISTTPYILNQKSGSVSAMFEHQLPVLCVARNWAVKGYNQRAFLNLTNYTGKESVSNYLNTKFIISNENSLEYVASKFLDGLK
jgi:glycosyltransferase involved in cell wall biosynthesis